MGALAGTRSRRAPALLASRLVVERTFGRWQVVDDADVGQPATRLIGLLAQRLATRKVQVAVGSSDEAAIDCLPRRPRWARAALAPDTIVMWDERRPGEAALS